MAKKDAWKFQKKNMRNIRLEITMKISKPEDSRVEILEWFDEFMDYLKNNRNIMWGEDDEAIMKKIWRIIEEYPYLKEVSEDVEKEI